MLLQIRLEDTDSKKNIINLKDFIDKSLSDENVSTEIERVERSPGELGGGDILGSIKMIIDAAQKPLVELVKCLYKYVSNYRTTIVIPTKDGKEIKLSHGRSMSAEEMQKIAVAIQEANK